MPDHYHCVNNYKFSQKPLAIDIGSNDGTLLEGFKKNGVDNATMSDPSGSALSTTLGDCEPNDGGSDDGGGSDYPVSLSLTNIDNDSFDVWMDNTSDVGGFQISFTGIDVVSAAGGSSADAGFMISTNSSMVLGFSLSGGTIPAGSGVLLTVDYASGSDICFDMATMSDPVGSALDTYLGGCNGEDGDTGGTDGGSKPRKIPQG